MSTEQTTSLEQRALEFAKDTKALRKRILEARAVMVDVARAFFTPGHWDIRNKRLYSNCGTWALEWAVRTHPSKPESPDNQGTSNGTIRLVPVIKES